MARRRPTDPGHGHGHGHGPDPDRGLDDDLVRRARIHAALGDPVRLGIVEELQRSDRSPSELADRFGLASNLLQHHLSILDAVDLIERVRSAGDRRRRYLRLRPAVLRPTGVPLDPALDPARDPALDPALDPPLFVCTHNSARSQLAAALWRYRTGQAADSAGTEPSPAVHPGAVAAARRRGLELGDRVPRMVGPGEIDAAPLVITVCDRAREEVDLPPTSLHWSIPDPVGSADAAAFDTAADLIDRRILDLTGAMATFDPSSPDRPTQPRRRDGSD